MPRGFSPFEWCPNVEPLNSPEARFLTNTPQALMRSGQFLQIPAIIGFTDVSLKTLSKISIEFKFFHRLKVSS